jgi:hypothetical protein
MTEVSKYYASCMKYEVQPGNAADLVGEVGRIIAGIGQTLDFSGQVLTKFGLYGSTISGVWLSGVAARELYDAKEPFWTTWAAPELDSEASKPALSALKNTGVALGAGLGLSVISKPVTLLGSAMNARATQCIIGDGLNNIANKFSGESDL